MSENASEAAIDRFAQRAVTPTAALTGALAVAWGWYVVAAPLDSVQGIVQKILYVHPPMAFSAYAGFFVTALGGGLYLWRRDAQWDRLAAAAAEVGVLFGALMIATGPIWAKATWGKWWSWDLRLTLTLLLFLVYLSYLLLRSFTEGSEQVARFSAVYAILGLAVIPLNYFAIDLAGGRSIHPENVERESFGPGMGLPFLLGVLTSLAAFLHLLARRLVIARLQHEVAERDAAAGVDPWDT